MGGEIDKGFRGIVWRLGGTERDLETIRTQDGETEVCECVERVSGRGSSEEEDGSGALCGMHEEWTGEGIDAWGGRKSVGDDVCECEYCSGDCFGMQGAIVQEGRASETMRSVFHGQKRSTK